MTPARLPLAPLFLLAAAAAALLPTARALSWPLCEPDGTTWVTEHPHTDPRFPGADLFCEFGAGGATWLQRRTRAAECTVQAPALSASNIPL